MSGTSEEGITIALSAVQMAAVLEGQSLEQGGTLGNRIIGGLRLLGCAGEAVGAAALAAAPEPTFLTKAGAVGLAAHAADMCTTGGRQLWTGRNERTLTDRGTSAVATALGASPAMAQNIGVATEFIVPIGGAALAGAVRVGAVRAGRISLLQHEAQAGTRLGGHTIAKHVGQSEAALRARLAAEPRIVAASSFTTRAVAETHISRALKANLTRITQWSQTARPGARMTPPITFDAGTSIGYGVVRASGQLQQMTRMRIVLKKETYNGMTHYILTAFPIP